MGTVLAYTSPALGHLLPISALLAELGRRGHAVHVRTLSDGVGIARQFGFEAEPIDPRIEAIELDDWHASKPLEALEAGIAALGKRAVREIDDLARAVGDVRPDALVIDVNCWGALSTAEASGLPWVTFSPFTPPMRCRGMPPFGPGLRPIPGVAGRLRDAAVSAVVTRSFERIMRPPVDTIRTRLDLPPVRSMDAFLRRSPLIFIASGAPFQYPFGDWGEGVHMIGPCDIDVPSDDDVSWLDGLAHPVVLVTTSSEKQADADLVSIAFDALRDEPVHVVATVPAGDPADYPLTGNATVHRFLPHGPVLDRAVCAVTHGGMGATQKALTRGVPVCVVPYGRDQTEVARRVTVARCGTRIPSKRLSDRTLRAGVRQAMTMSAGARRVAAGFAATGGVRRGADLFEQRVLGR
ncbi:glycosyltransferase [Mycobacterium sp. PS03-16]|uniref:nucleotide disphospho-sugar-binding domain-containing protein n=1 Tax=Mycobacterium sp. PS03-16 TaxID=2559611 RepID=UPI00107420B2|nr:nucleotide disphospho-sugar-binding domain-containing protein [Mycobacterium sp. PS03-16]TFV59252.1 glycosyltransferase [Mycobacterium sp. PS03-16]